MSSYPIVTKVSFELPPDDGVTSKRLTVALFETDEPWNRCVTSFQVGPTEFTVTIVLNDPLVPSAMDFIKSLCAVHTLSVTDYAAGLKRSKFHGTPVTEFVAKQAISAGQAVTLDPNAIASPINRLSDWKNFTPITDVNPPVPVGPTDVNPDGSITRGKPLY